MTPKSRHDKENNLDTEFVKDEKNPTRDYIFQKDKITKRSFLFVLALILLLIIAVAVTSVFLE